MKMHSHKHSQIETKLAYLEAEYQEVMSAISHDLSAPLRQAEGFSEIILKNNEAVFDDKTKRHFGFITQGATTAKDILEALRDFSHLNRSNAPFAPLDSGLLVQDVLQTLSDWIQQSEAEINTGDLPVILGDKEQIRLVFFHLLKNALFYRDSAVQTKINITCQDEANDWVFKVTDNGIGIAKNMDERIFRVLKRGVLPEHYPGHGMGLAIAKKIIHRHGGSIQLLREKAEETTFCFTLPKHPRDI